MLNQTELEKLTKAILVEKGIKESEWKKQIIREAKEALFISENIGKGTPYYEITTLLINAEREKLVNEALTDLYGKDKAKKKETKEIRIEDTNHENQSTQNDNENKKSY